MSWASGLWTVCLTCEQHRQINRVQRTLEQACSFLRKFEDFRGWQSGLALTRKRQLLERNDIGLAAALEWAASTDIFFIPKGHFPGYTPDDDAEGWWYSVKGKERCRKCFQCHRRAAHHDFSRREWIKKSPATCVLCTNGRGEKRAREGGLKRALTKNQISRDRVAVGRQGGQGKATGTKEVTSTRPKRPRRAATSTRISLADRSESESETEIQEDEWPDHEAQACIILVPANPQYVGRGNDSNGGEIAYTVPEIRDLLRDQPGYGQMWLTTGQMGWSLVQERNEIVNAQDNMEGKPWTWIRRGDRNVNCLERIQIGGVVYVPRAYFMHGTRGDVDDCWKHMASSQ